MFQSIAATVAADALQLTADSSNSRRSNEILSRTLTLDRLPVLRHAVGLLLHPLPAYVLSRRQVGILVSGIAFASHVVVQMTIY